MLKWIEATGRSEEAAIQNALAQLGLDRDSVSVEVLERARNGFLGFGSSPAKVKVTYEVSQEEAPVSPVEEIFAPAPQPKPAATPARPAEAAPKGPAKAEAPASPVPGAKPGDLEERIRAFLSGLLAHMGVEAAIHVSPKGDNGILVTLEGPKLGALIGHRGETLDAIQQLTSYAVNRTGGRVRVQLDAEGYREKREQSLQNLAKKVAGKVVKYRRSVTLEPMNAYERHVIHTALQEVPGVTTYSTGVDPNRRVIVAYDRDKR